MSKSRPAILPWVQALQTRITPQLTERYGKNFTSRQAGPYGSGLAGVFFNDESLYSVRSPVETDRFDFRFGFEIMREYVRGTGVTD
jgi:hypothetical protein